VSSLGGVEDLLLLLLLALFPALVYLTWIRRSERYEQEPWSRLLSGFAWGALIATFVAGFLELLLLSAGAALSNAVPAPEFTFLSPTSPWNTFFLVLLIAPLTEEGLKALGTVRSLGPLRVLADGPVVGASVGLGFGFLETFLYGLGAFLAGGLVAGIVLIAIRSVSSVLLHGSSTAMFGYGYARSNLKLPGAGTGSYYLLAVVMHASFNVLASLAILLPLVGLGGILTADEASVIGLFAAIAFAVAALNHVEHLVAQSAFPGASGSSSRYRPPSVQPRYKS
jgi:RsiW-degrading membrane proteinase PrsW (M82 family)